MPRSRARSRAPSRPPRCAARASARWWSTTETGASCSSAAPIGALMANYSAYAVVVTGGDAKGKPVAVAVDPPLGFFRVSNQAHTGPGKRLVVEHRAVDGGEEVVVTGASARGAERTFQRSVL